MRPTTHTNACRQARRIAEKMGHLVSRFKTCPGSEDSRIGREYYAECRFCGQVVQVLFLHKFRENAIEDGTVTGMQPRTAQAQYRARLGCRPDEYWIGGRCLVECGKATAWHKWQEK